MTPEERCNTFRIKKGDRVNWESYWQTVHDYWAIETDNINRTYSPGDELDFVELYDATSLNLANILPSGLMHRMTPFSGHWIGLRHKDPMMNNKRAVGRWYKEAEDEIFYILSNSNFYDEIFSFYKDTSIYGTANIYIEPDFKDVVRFRTIPIKQCYISDDSRGRTNEYYIEFQYTKEQAIDRFGREKLGTEILDAQDGSNKKWDFLLYIGPRYDRNDMKDDNVNMPIQASWYDQKNKSLVMESGYENMPAFTHRFYKRSNLEYGFSPAMMALMNTRYASVMAQTQLISSMMHAQPAYAVPSDTFLQPLNFNPLVINEYDSREPMKDKIIPLGLGGDVNTNEMMLQKQYDNMKEAMFYDAFVSFQDVTKQMTIPEVQQRVNEQLTRLGPAAGRFASVLRNIIESVVSYAAQAGRLPQLPPELQEYPNYEIEFTSQLMLAQKSHELNALQTALAMTAEVAQFDPNAAAKIDAGKYVDSVWAITGADPSVKRDDSEVEKILAAAAEQQAQAVQTEQDSMQAATAKDASQAEKNMATAANA